jgi:hypothetical protein
MKKFIGIIFIATVIFFYKTNSMYVEWTEIYIMIGSLSTVSVACNLFSKEDHKISRILYSSALIGFIGSLIFSFTDLVIDHFEVIKGVPDGRFLTIGETISEFSDDLLIIAIIVMFSVISISSLSTVILSKLYKNSSL